MSLRAINNVYELPSIKRVVQYLHGAAGFPTKETWLRGIHKGNYLSWPLITIKNVNKHFPESEETQKGHMRNLQLGVRSTKTKQTSAPPLAASPLPSTPVKAVFITINEPRETIFTDQTGKFTIRSSRGNQYQMIVHDIDSSSSWIGPMKNRTEGEMILSGQ